MAVLVDSMCDSKMYNQLRLLGAATSEFTERDAIFEMASALLATYDYKWGIGLVHRHCRLADGEIMLTDGNVTEPVYFTETGLAHPERWLSTGQPYEFTTRATEQPPAALFDEFRAIAGDAANLLGLYHIDLGEANTWQVERTEGRKNIVEKATSQPAQSPTMIEAGWVFGQGSSRPSYCQQYCNQNSSGNHVGSTHVISQSRDSCSELLSQVSPAENLIYCLCSSNIVFKKSISDIGPI